MNLCFPMSENPSKNNPTIAKANEIFERASGNISEINLYLDKYEKEQNPSIKELFLHHLMNLIRIQELLIQSHTRLTSIESKVFNLTNTIRILEGRSEPNPNEK